jgi:hypothetical protein
MNYPTFFFLIAFSSYLPAYAQPDSSYQVDHHKLLSSYRQWQKQHQQIAGYRIQLSSSEDRATAYDKKARLYQQFPGLKSYVTYEQPYFRLRLGDFTDRLTATFYLMKIITLYPEAFIVRDFIKPIQR